jgi:hypothetical protein
MGGRNFTARKRPLIDDPLGSATRRWTPLLSVSGGRRPTPVSDLARLKVRKRSFGGCGMVLQVTG